MLAKAAIKSDEGSGLEVTTAIIFTIAIYILSDISGVCFMLSFVLKSYCLTVLVCV